MEYNPVGRFEIYVTDMERAKKFYQQVFQKGDWIDLSQDKIRMFAFPRWERVSWAAWALVQMDDYWPSDSWTIVYFSCEDCSVEESRIKENGGQVHQSKMSVGEFGFVSMVRDTEGNMIGLHSQV